MISNDQLHLGWTKVRVAELLREADDHRLALHIRRVHAAEPAGVRVPVLRSRAMPRVLWHRTSASRADPCESC